MHYPIEKQLLSLIHCGCYINTQDIILIGNSLNIDLSFKRRSLILQTLFIEAQKEGKIELLIKHMMQLLESKKETMLHLLTHYPHAKTFITPQLTKIAKMQQRLQEELILHVKGL